MKETRIERLAPTFTAICSLVASGGNHQLHDLAVAALLLAAYRSSGSRPSRHVKMAAEMKAGRRCLPKKPIPVE
jgi:hypothetical protein